MAVRRTNSVPKTSSHIPDRALTLAKIDGVLRLARLVVTFAGICFVILCSGYALRPFAGQVTIVSLVFSFLADIKFAVAVTLAGAASAWAVAERVLRRRKTEQLQGRIIELERRIDPERTSSDLTPQGTTNPRDR